MHRAGKPGEETDVAQQSNAARRQDEAVTYQESIPPFWTKIPTFLAFPHRGGPLATILLLAAASSLGGIIIFINGFVAYLFLRYAFSVMELASNGDFNPESPDISMWGGKDHRPAKQTFVVLFYIALVFGASVWLARPAPVAPKATAVAQAPAQAAAPAGAEEDDEETSPEQAAARRELMATLEAADPPEPEMVPPKWFWLLPVLFAIPLPAAFMVIAVEDSLPRALNPLTTFQYVGAMGGGYFILWAFFMPIIGLRFALASLLPDMSAFVKLPILFAVGSYLLLALFAMMGYCLYQYHKELGYAVKVDFDQHLRAEAKAAAPAPSKPVDPLTKKIEGLLEAGKVDDAIRVVQDELRFAKHDADLHERLHKLYVRKNDNALIVKHGPEYLKALLLARRHAAATKAVNLLKALDAAFEPGPDHLLGLAEGAFAARDFNRAVELVRGFDKRFPGHADIPGVYYLGARILSEHGRDDAKAKQVLNAILQRYPDAPVAAEARRYLDALSGTQATPSPA